MHEDDLLPISALQHLLFCERQCALIHVERLWAENRLTVEGQHLHKKAHKASSEWKEGTFVARGLRLRSLELGVWGQADIVEFTPASSISPNEARAQLANFVGLEPESDGFDAAPGVPSVEQLLTPPLRPSHFVGWQVTPIEYKRGRPKKNDSDRVQLCAQAICLEEMLGIEVPAGAIYYGKQRRRTDVIFDAGLRGRTQVATERLLAMVAAHETPRAAREPKCDACSLIQLCLPDAMARASASRFVSAELTRSLGATGPTTDTVLSE